jgi:hypothetical protein
MKKKKLLLWSLLLVVLSSQGCATIRGMGGRYTEHRESREKDSLWRIGEPLTAVHPLFFYSKPLYKSKVRQVLIIGP